MSQDGCGQKQTINQGIYQCLWGVQDDTGCWDIAIWCPEEDLKIKNKLLKYNNILSEYY